MPYHRVEHLNHQDVRITEFVVHSFEMGGGPDKVDNTLKVPLYVQGVA